MILEGRLRRGLIFTGVAGVGLLAMGGAGIWLLSSHHAPGPLALSPNAREPSPSSAAGLWTVAPGSQVGYRVKEQFINQPAQTEAVARTSTVSGGLRITVSGSSLTATDIHFSADLASLRSQDRYASYQVYQRDFFVRSVYLETDVYPSADFTAAPVAIPPGLTAGPIALTASGDLKVHGVSRHVTANMQVQLNGGDVEVAGSMTVDMRDFGIEVPDISFTRAQPSVVIEFHLLLARG